MEEVGGDWCWETARKNSIWEDYRWTLNNFSARTKNSSEYNRITRNHFWESKEDGKAWQKDGRGEKGEFGWIVAWVAGWLVRRVAGWITGWAGVWMGEWIVHAKNVRHTCVWMSGGTPEWVDGYLDEQLDRWLCGELIKWLCREMDDWLCGELDECPNRYLDKWSYV